jgi:hypothetical protein
MCGRGRSSCGWFFFVGHDSADARGLGCYDDKKTDGL